MSEAVPEGGARTGPSTPRRLAHLDGLPGPLDQNARHRFALRHALRIPRANALYTMIPKNGCSTLRFSVMKANGLVGGLGDVDWIHDNNLAFGATVETALASDYAFVVLRCPFGRLYSAFTDKVVDIDTESWTFWKRDRRRPHPHDVTFRQFVANIADAPPGTLDPHWRPQSAFLLFAPYDDYFALEAFGDAANTIERRTGMAVVDTRDALGHDSSRVAKVDMPGAADLPAVALLDRKRGGTLPTPRSLYDEQTVLAARKLYAADLALYERFFGPSELMARLARP